MMRPVIKTDRYKPALWAALALFVATACGGDTRPPKTPTNGDKTDTVTQPTGAFRIGVIVPESGALAAFGPPVKNAIQLAVTEINAAGGVGGKNVELAFADSRSTPEGGLEAAVVLANDNDIRALIGALSSGVTTQVITIGAKNNLATISPASTSPSLPTDDTANIFFRTVPSDSVQGVVLARYAYEQGYRRAAIMYVDNAYGDNLQKVFTENFETVGAADGKVIKPLLPHEESDAAPDYSRDLEAIADMDPPADVIVLITYESQGARILQDHLLFADKISADFLLADGLRTTELSKEAGADTLAGIKGTAPAPPSGAVYDAFFQAFQQTHGQPPGAFTGPAYDAVYLIALAAAKADSLAREAILDQLRVISAAPGEAVTPGQIPGQIPEGEVDFAGASGPVDWDAAGDPTSAVYEVYEFQPDGSISQVELLTE